MLDLTLPTLVNLAALGLGAVFGGIVQKTNFCTMGAVSDFLAMGDAARLRSWLLAIGVAILGTQALSLGGLVNLGTAIYGTTNLGWLGAILGGALFGFGMVLAGGCGSRTLVRVGAGNLKSLIVVIVMAVTAYATLRGILGPVRQALEGATNIDLKGLGLRSQYLPDLLAFTGLSSATLQLAIALIAGGGLVAASLADAHFRRQQLLVLGGLGVGICVIAGWAITGILGADEFEPAPLASLTFVAPIGEGLVYLMTFTGAKLNFGISLVAGVVIGAFLTARFTGTFRVESFASREDLIGHLVGGVLMGAGGVLALGCSVGQGLTGLSTLSLGSVLAFAGIVTGAALGIRYLEEGSLGAAARALFAAQ